jgi:hypothetical protein
MKVLSMIMEGQDGPLVSNDRGVKLDSQNGLPRLIKRGNATH